MKGILVATSPEGIIGKNNTIPWHYSEDLKRFILSKVPNETLADDILQDTFIKIHTKLHTLNNVTKLKSWIFTIARNSIMDHFKTFKAPIEMNETMLKIDAEENLHTEKDCLRGILKNLPHKYSNLFLYCVFWNSFTICCSQKKIYCFSGGGFVSICSFCNIFSFCISSICFQNL